jgi:acetyltransferase-like isoleucine patch superfamily enzyme
MLKELKQDLLKSVFKQPFERRFQALLRAGRVTIGRHSYGFPEVVTFGGDPTRLHIGHYVSIGRDVRFLLGGNHRVDWVTTFPIRKVFGLAGANNDGHPSSKGDVIVGNDVWLGFGAKILSGVVIGDGAVIGAYATVTRSVRPYAIVTGSPARETRRRFSDAQVEGLLRVAWWNWSDAKVCAEVSQLCSENIDAFLARHGAQS